MQRSVTEWFRLDLRSLALFRILVAALVAIDLAQRGLQWDSLYGDRSVLPASEWLHFGVDPWPLAEWLDALGLLGPMTIACGLLACLALASGFLPRRAAVVAWIVLAAVQARNPFLNYGADVLLRQYLLWCALLPLDAAWTLRRTRPAADLGWAPQLGLQLQVCTVFLIAGLAKAVDPIWQAGLGVSHALDHEFLVTGLGKWMFTHPHLTWLLTHATLILELAGPILLYSPWARPWLRLGVVLSLAFTCAGFNLGLHVGLFPPAGWIGFVVFLPPEFWERCRIPTPAAVDSAPSWLRAIVGCFVAAVVSFILVWNVGLWSRADYRAPWPLSVLGDALRLEQRWGMFTRIPSTGWINVPGRLADGKQVELLAVGGPIPPIEAASAYPTGEVAPPSMATHFDTIRWRVFFLGMTESEMEMQRRVDVYLRYACREWNRRESGVSRLVGAEVVYHWRRPRTDPAEPVGYERTVLGQWTCPGDPASH